MIAGANPKGEQKKRLTQKRAAEILGVTPWYLNRVVRGHIKSVRLSRRLAELQFVHPNPPGDPTQPAQPDPAMNENPRFPTGRPENQNPSPPLTSGFPADINYTEEMADELGKIGLSVIAIEMSKCPRGYGSNDFILALAKDFAIADFGKFDESKFQPKIHHFFHGITTRLPVSLEFLKSKLAQGELLAISIIWYRDEYKTWRQFYPGADVTPT